MPSTLSGFTTYNDPRLYHWVTRIDLGYQGWLLSGRQAWDDYQFPGTRRMHVDSAIATTIRRLNKFTDRPRLDIGRGFRTRSANLSRLLAEELRDCGLSFVPDGPRATISCDEDPHPAVAQIIQSEGFDNIGIVYQASEQESCAGIKIYKGTVFGALSAARGRTMGLHRNVFLIGGADMRLASWDWKNDCGNIGVRILCPDMRIQPTLQKARNVAKKLAPNLEQWRNYLLIERNEGIIRQSRMALRELEQVEIDPIDEAMLAVFQWSPIN